MTISALPPLPNPGDPVAVFNARAFEFWAGLPQFRTEANELAAGVSQAWVATNTARDTAVNSATSADGSSRAAAASAELAAGYAGAPPWSAVAVYVKDAVVFSPSTRTMYRRKSAGSGGGDPAADAANWAPVVLAVGGNAVWHAGNFNPANYFPVSGGTVDGNIHFTGMNSGNPRAVRFGASGGNYGGIGYGINYTAASGTHTYALSDLVSRIDLYDGLRVYAADAGQVGAAVVWTEVLAAGRSAFRYRGSDVWHAGNDDAFMRRRNSVIPIGQLDAARPTGMYQFDLGSSTAAVIEFAGMGGSTPRIQLVAHYSDEFYLRAARDNDANFDGMTYEARRLWHSGNFNPDSKQDKLSFTPYNSTNPSGFISGINKGMVTTALGFTPYSDANPSGFISGINRGMVTGVLGFTPYSDTNPSGFITSGGRAYPRRADGANINFYWAGQSGQPSWLWGGNDGTEMYIYNPSNFSVAYAASAGTLSGGASVSELYNTGWWRSVGRVGWYSQDYGGGIWMNDADYVRVYGGKHFQADGRLFGNGSSGNGLGKVTLSTGQPSGGAQGDIWVVY